MVKLSEVYMGMVVAHCHAFADDLHTVPLMGMVVGISQNSVKEPLLVVQWQNDQTFAVHHDNLDKVEDYER